MTRFWPMWALYGLFWLLFLPALLFQQLGAGGLLRPGFCDEHIVYLSAQVGLLVTFGFSVLFAMALFSYLFQHRSAVSMHALPLRRECLFLTNYLSGLAFFLLPLLVNFVLLLGVELLAGQLNVGTALVWLSAQVCYALFFFSFAVFCAMFTGHILALPAFYGVLSLLPTGLALLLNEALSQFVFGYTTSSLLVHIAEVLTPVVQLYLMVSPSSNRISETETIYYITGWGWILLYAAAGLCFALAALLVYRRRQVESAGDVVSVRVVRPVFLYGVSTCAALTFGLGLFSMFGDAVASSAAWQLLVCMLLAGFVGYFAAQMLLQKSLRVWRGHWPGFAALAAALALLITGMEFDLFGFERNVPRPEQVTSVSLSGTSFPPYDQQSGSDSQDPELIAQFIALHQTIVAERQTLQRELEEWQGIRTVPDDAPADRVVWLNLRYTLRNGAELCRTYHIRLQETGLADPASLESRLQDILNHPAALADYFGDLAGAEPYTADIAFYGTQEEALSFYDPAPADDIAAETPTTEATSLRQEYTFSGEEAALLFRAVQEDLEHGRIGAKWVLETAEYRQLALNVDIHFTFRTMNERTQTYSYSGQPISVTRRSTSTLAALRSLGFLCDVAFPGE